MNSFDFLQSFYALWLAIAAFTLGFVLGDFTAEFKFRVTEKFICAVLIGFNLGFPLARLFL